MNKTAYLKELDKRLRYIPKDDREDAVAYYSELMSDMELDEAEDVETKLGPAKEAAKKILAECTQKHVDDYAENKTVKGHATVVWLSVLGVLSLPLSLPLAIMVFALAVALIAVALSLLISLAAVALSLIVSGICSIGVMFIAPGFAQKMAVLGTGLVALGLGSLLGYGLFVLVRFLFRKIFRRSTKTEAPAARQIAAGSQTTPAAGEIEADTPAADDGEVVEEAAEVIESPVAE